jgi:hypothetical protein
MARRKVNKMQLVRDVVSERGKDIMPLEIVKIAKEKHGVTMSPDMASTYKSSVLKQLGMAPGGKTKPGRKPGRKPGPQAAAVTNGSRTSGGISLNDIRAVKELAARIGADKVRQLAEVLA